MTSDPNDVSNIPEAPSYTLTFTSPPSLPKVAWHRDPRLKATLWWAWLTVAGGTLGVVMAFVMPLLVYVIFFETLKPSFDPTNPTPYFLTWFLFGGGVGLGLSIVQGIAIRKFLAEMDRSLWKRFCSIGTGLGFTLYFMALYGFSASGLAFTLYDQYLGFRKYPEDSVPGYVGSLLRPDMIYLISVGLSLLSLCIVGFFVGGAQWLVLRRGVAKAWQWIPISMAGWCAAGIVVFVHGQVWQVQPNNGLDVFLHGVASGFVFLFVLGAVSGYGLLFLLKVPPEGPKLE
jgi:hypothetical protein